MNQPPWTIRPLERSDAVHLHKLRYMPGVFETILGLPSERILNSEAFFDSLGRNDHQLVAVVRDEDGQERAIGTAGLTVSTNPRLAHTAGFGIMIHRDYQDKGLGTALMEAILDIADNWLMLVRIELTAFEGNTRAIHLYEKMGFEREGVKRHAAIRNGRYENEVLMARIRWPYQG